MGSPFSVSPMSPLSPVMGSMRNRVPRQIARVLPAYCMALLILALIFNSDYIFSPFGSSDVSKRAVEQQAVLSSGSKFPRKIWQTWKVGPLSFDFKDQAMAKTWTAKNPGHRYEVLTDDNDMEYVEFFYGPDNLNRPDIVDMYRQITARIIKADLLRYLVMYAEGGVYADIDVEALRPVSRFVPERWNEGQVDMIIGVEIDEPTFKDHDILGPKSQSFCQWTFVCKPKQAVMLQLVDNILQWLRDVAAKQDKPVSDIVLDFDEVLTGTGPSAFTNAILAEMTKREGKDVTWDSFHSMAESKIVGGFLVLTVEAFAAGQGHSDSGNHNARTALVKHHYHASQWPANHPRFNHPVYGEVERCNWNKECVQKWDEDSATFKTLPPAEQTRLITEKEAADKKAAEEAKQAEQAKLAADLKHLSELKAAEDAKQAQQEKALSDLTAAGNQAEADKAAAALQQIPHDPKEAQAQQQQQQAVEQHLQQQQPGQQPQPQQPQPPEQPQLPEAPKDQPKEPEKPKDQEQPKENKDQPQPPKEEEKPKDEQKPADNKEQELKREENKAADQAPPS